MHCYVLISFSRNPHPLFSPYFMQHCSLAPPGTEESLLLPEVSLLCPLIRLYSGPRVRKSACRKALLLLKFCTEKEKFCSSLSRLVYAGLVVSTPWQRLHEGITGSAAPTISPAWTPLSDSLVLIICGEAWLIFLGDTPWVNGYPERCPTDLWGNLKFILTYWINPACGTYWWTSNDWFPFFIIFSIHSSLSKDKIPSYLADVALDLHSLRLYLPSLRVWSIKTSPGPVSIIICLDR